MRAKSWLIGFALIGGSIGLTMSSCRSGGDTQPQWYSPVETKSLKVGKVMGRVAFEVPADFKNSLTPEQLSELIKKGCRFEDNKLLFPSVPLEGYRVKINGQYIPVGSDGVFEVPASLTTTRATAELYYQISDEEPMARFSIAELVEYGGTPKPTIIEITVPFESLSRMDGKGFTTSSENPSRIDGRESTNDCVEIKCDISVNDFDRGCCEDFLGPYGDKKNYPLNCPQALINFFRSICSGRALEFVCPIPIETEEGVGCFRTHKGRWCQFLRDDECGASVDGSAASYFELRSGETLVFTVINNTPANSTQIDYRVEPAMSINQDLFSLSPESVANGSLVRKGSTLYSVDHWVVDGNIPRFTKQMSVVFTAPDLPKEQKEVLVTVRFTWWRKSSERVVRVKVINPECE